VSAWNSFAERVAAAEQHVLRDARSPRARADALAYVTGLARVALAQWVGGADPEAPRFVENPSPSAKWGAENADNRYLWAPVRPDAVYRIHGRRGTSFELLFEVKEGFMQLGAPRNFAARAASALRVEPDGRFELWLGGPERDACNWLPLDPDARWILVREYFVDWEREAPASLAIERADADPPPLARDADRVAAQLARAGEWVEATARFWSEWVAELRAAYVPGKLAPARRYEGGADDILYGNDWFALDDDQALVLECEVPDAAYWAFQLVDGCFRSLDWAEHQTSLNHTQASVDADRRVRIVVARRDPGVANWLDTTGLREGVLQYRFIWARTTCQPAARIVPIAALGAELSGAAHASAADRAAMRAMRRRHAARRSRYDPV
jgi:hypothetical protein